MKYQPGQKPQDNQRDGINESEPISKENYEAGIEPMMQVDVPVSKVNNQRISLAGMDIPSDIVVYAKIAQDGSTGKDQRSVKRGG